MKKKVKIYIEKVSNDYMYGITLTYLTSNEKNRLSLTERIQLGNDRESFYSFDSFGQRKLNAQINDFLVEYCKENNIDSTSKFCKLVIVSDFTDEFNASK